MAHNHRTAMRGWDGVAHGSLGRMLASQFGQNRAGGGDRPEQGRGLGEMRADRWVPAISNWGAHALTGRLHAREWVGVSAEQGRPRRKRLTMIFSILNPFSN
jgi:hypothetical protein